MKSYILIDIGGTAIKYGLLDENEHLYYKDKTPTESEKGGAYIQQKVIGLIGKLAEKCRAAHCAQQGGPISEQLASPAQAGSAPAVRQQDPVSRIGKSSQECEANSDMPAAHPSPCRDYIAGVAISSAGMVDVEKGCIFHAGPTIPGYAGTQFKAPIEAHFGVPCEIENDVKCAGLAESVSGAGRGASSMVCLTIGTGIGGCIVLNGKVLHGWTCSAGEIGYMHMGSGPWMNGVNGTAYEWGPKAGTKVDRHAGIDTEPLIPKVPDVPEDSFEMYASASALSRRVARLKGEDPAKWDGLHIFRALHEGDQDCAAAVDEMCDLLGRGIANICYVVNPQIVVLGGGIMAQKEDLYPRIRAAVDRYLVPVIARSTVITMAQQGNDAGMIGAYYHFRQRQSRSS